MKNIPDFAVSSQEAGFDKFLKVYNEYFKFDFFGNAKFYGAKNGENYQTGQAWITPITPSQAIALLTNQTTDKMNTLANTCFQYDGSDDSKNIIRIMNKNHRSDFKGNDKYFYWIANDIADTFYKMDKDLTEIPPYEYLALLTGKQLTEADLIVGNRFECIEKRHDSFSLFTRGCTHTCEINGTITDSMGREVRLDNEALNRHFKLLPQESVKERNGDPSMYDMIQLVEQLESDKFHLQQQLKELQENAEMDSLTIHSLRTQLSGSFKECNFKTEQLKEAKELITQIDFHLNYYGQIDKDTQIQINQFLTRNQ